MDYTVAKCAILAGVGVVAGMAGGMLGIGGSVVFIPALAQLFPETGYGVFAAAALVCNVFVGAGGAVGHMRNRRVIPRVVKMIIPLGIAGAVVGVLVANVLEKGFDRVLWLVFGAVVCYMLVNNVRRLFRGGHPPALTSGDALEAQKVTVSRASAVALPTGLLAGMLGIGGGVYSVPSQQIFLGMPQKNAIANSSATMVVFCAIAAVVKNVTVQLPTGYTHWDPLALAGLLIPFAIVGAFVGGHLTHRLPERLVRGLFVGFLVWTAYKCFFVNGDLPGLIAELGRSGP